MHKIIAFLWIVTILATIALLSFDPAHGQDLPGFPTMSSTAWVATPTLNPFTPTPLATMTPTAVQTPTARPTIAVTVRPWYEHKVFLPEVRR